MPLVKLCPILQESQFDNNGDFNDGGMIQTVLAGTSTNAATYTDSTGIPTHQNPITLNTRGEPPSEIWLPNGVEYDLIMKDSNGNTLRTYEDIQGINEVDVTISQWQDYGDVPSYLTPTTLSIPGDRTSVYQVNRRFKVQVSAGERFGYISNSVFGASTTLTLAFDSGTLDVGLNSIELGLNTPDNTSLPILPDSTFRVSGSVDKSKRIAFEVDGLTTSTTRTATFPDKDIVVAGISDIPVEQTAKIQPITASVLTNALTATLNPTVLDFRSSPVSSGSVATRKVSTAISVVVPSTATLGSTNSVLSRLALIAIDNAGTVELAIANLSGLNNLDESTLISTTAISAASNSSSVIYSTTARSSVPFRVVGYIESTQATAGTWANPPSLIQGAGSVSSNKISLGISAFYQSPQQTITAAGSLTLAHGIGRIPTLVKFVLQCVTGELGFTAGQELTETLPGFNNGARGVSIVPDATNLVCRYGSDVNVFAVLRQDTGAASGITPANWRLVIRAWG